MHQGATNVRGGCGGLALLQTTTRPAGEHEILLHYTKIHNCLLNPGSSELSDKKLYQKSQCVSFIYLPDCKNNWQLPLLRVFVALDPLIIKADMSLHSVRLGYIKRHKLLFKDTTESCSVFPYFLPPIFHKCCTLSFRKTSPWFPHITLGQGCNTVNSLTIQKMLICSTTQGATSGSMGRWKNLPNLYPTSTPHEWDGQENLRIFVMLHFYSKLWLTLHSMYRTHTAMQWQMQRI